MARWLRFLVGFPRVTLCPSPLASEAPEKLSRQKIWWAIGLLAIASVVVYANALDNRFVYDDELLTQREPRIRDLKNIPLFFIPPVEGPGVRSFGYRPIRMITYALDYRVFGLNPRGYHATNIVFHIVTSVLSFLLAIRLLGNPLPALIVALLFTVHPVQTEAVSYVTGRKDELVTIFYLAGLFYFLRYREQPSLRYLLGIIVAYVLALLSKESGITLPLMLLLFDTLMGLKGEEGQQGTIFRPWLASLQTSWRRFRPLFLGLFFIAALFGYYVVVYSGASTRKEFWGGGLGPALLTSARIHLHYIKLLLFPATLSASYSYNAFPVSSTIFDASGLMAVAGVTAILSGLIGLAKISRMAAFGGLWFFITLLPVSQLVPHHILLAERHLYLPSFGFALMGGVLFRWLQEHTRSRRSLYACTVVALLILSARTIVRNRDWRDDFTLWSKTVQTAPESASAHATFGELLRRRGRLDEAEPEFRTALGIDPDDSRAHVGMGALLAMREQWGDAERELKIAVRLDPTFWRGYLELGRLYQLQGRWIEAEAPLRTAVQLEPYFDEAHLNLGLVHLNQGRRAEAEKEVRTALAINPRSADVHLALGRIALEDGRATDALRHFQDAAGLESGNAFVHNNLGVLYLQRGQVEQALVEFQAALRIRPDFEEARANLVRLYLLQGKAMEAERVRQERLRRR